MNPLTKLTVVALVATSVSSAFAGGKVVRLEKNRDAAAAQQSSRKTATVAALKGDRGVAAGDRDERPGYVKQVLVDNVRSETLTFWVRQ